MEPFNLEYLESLVSSGDLKTAKEYINSYFVQVLKQGIFFRDAETQKWLHVPKEQLWTYLPEGLQFGKWTASKYLVNEVMARYKMVVSPTQPYIDHQKRQINMMSSQLHQINSNYDPSDLSDGLQAWLDHIFIVWCNRNENTYKYVLNWLSCTVAGRKLKTCLFLASREQTGKGIVIDFLADHVLGQELVLMESNMETLEKYTKPLEGRLLVNINEMPCSSTGIWLKVKDMVKTLVTDSTFTCREMYKAGYTQVNTANYIMFSNNEDAILMQRDNNVRFVPLDVNEEKRDDYEYWENLIDCKNSSVGQEFYNYMIYHYESEGKHFDCRLKPQTDMLINKLAEGMPKPMRFIKDHYLSKGNGIKCSFERFHTRVSELYSRNPISKQKLSAMLKELGCFVVDKDGNFPRKVDKDDGRKKTRLTASYESLYYEFMKRHYISQIDDIDPPDSTVDPQAEESIAEAINNSNQTSSNLVTF